MYYDRTVLAQLARRENNLRHFPLNSKSVPRSEWAKINIGKHAENVALNLKVAIIEYHTAAGLSDAMPEFVGNFLPSHAPYWPAVFISNVGCGREEEEITS